MFRRGSDQLLGAALGALVALAACTEQPKKTGGGYVGSTSQARATSTPAEKKPPERAAGTEAGSIPEKAAPDPAPADAYLELTQLWGLGQLHDLAPAAPATATAEGIYFVTRRDQIAIARRVGRDGFQALDADPELFAKYGRGPAVSPTHVYWISERKQLLRLPVGGGEMEILFDHARAGTRTSVVTATGRDVVAFIAEIEGEPYAYVWASPGRGKAEILRLTPDGANATSVALVAGHPHPRAVVLSGRTAMSPVHVRRIRTTKIRLTLEADEVVWVGPGSHSLTEIHALGRPGDEAVAFLPTEKSFSDFGLAQLSIPAEPGELAPPAWLVYPNGIDPAPIATGKFCGKDYLLFARPTGPAPRSPQELHLVAIQESAPEQGELIARSRAFNELSMAPTKTGAVLAWTADYRTWGMVLTCPKK